MHCNGGAPAAPQSSSAADEARAVLNPMVQMAMRRELKEFAGATIKETTFLGGGSVTREQIGRIANWKERSLEAEKRKAALR